MTPEKKVKMHDVLFKRFSEVAKYADCYDPCLVAITPEEGQYLADTLRRPENGSLVGPAVFSLVYGDFHFWNGLTGINVIDPDGWDRSNPDWDKEMININEFVVRCSRSTVRNIDRLLQVASEIYEH